MRHVILSADEACLRTPFDEICEAEERVVAQDAEDEIAEWWPEACTALDATVDFVFADGPHPADVLWRFWSLAITFRRDEAADWRHADTQLFWQQGRPGSLFRLRLIFSDAKPTESDERIRAVLAVASGRARKRYGWQPGATSPRIADLLNPDRWSVTQSETIARLFDFAFAAGTDANRVMKRVYAVTKWLRSDLLMHMSLQQLGDLFDETKASPSWRIKQLVNDALAAIGMRGCNAGWQKRAGAALAYGEVQKGNRNRVKSRLLPVRRRAVPLSQIADTNTQTR
jgi:hypothetical protein